MQYEVSSKFMISHVTKLIPRILRIAIYWRLNTKSRCLFEIFHFEGREGDTLAVLKWTLGR
jgi:hypothetical protein